MASYWTRSKWEKVFVSEIWGTPGLHILSVEPDFMHTCCLGVLQSLLGNILWEVFSSMGGTITKHRSALAKLLSMIHVASRRLGCEPPINQLTIGMIRSKATGKPKCKTKAAEGRKLLPVVVFILQNFVPCDGGHEKLRMQCAINLLKVYEELAAWVDKDGLSLANMKKYGMRHLLLYAELARGQERIGESLLWALLPKHHLFAHVVQDMSCNPKNTWAYRLEDEIGKAADLAAGVNIEHMHTAFIMRLRALYDS